MKRTGVIVILALTFVLGATWYFAAFRPIDTARARSLTDEASARQQFELLSSQLARLESLETDRTQQDALARRLDAAVPPTPDLGAFIVEANAIATEAGISWIAIEPASTSTEITEGFTAIPVQIKIEGGFFSVLDYLNRLSDASRLVIVDRIVTAPLPPERAGGPVDPVNPKLGATMSTRIFTRAPAFSATGASVPTTTTTQVPGT